MPSSIVSTLSRILTPDIVGKLAIASGLERSLAQTAIAAAVPLLLSALARFLVDEPGAAKQLGEAVAAQPPHLLSSISSDLTASNLTRSTYMAIRGTSLLALLLGGGALGTLAATVAQFTGIGEGSARSLMGLLTPLIMGVLGREQRATGLDANGLAQMLIAQNEKITAAMPSGLGQVLKARQLHEDISSRATPNSRTYAAPTGPGYYAAAMQRASAEKNTWRVIWRYCLPPLLALVRLLWSLAHRGLRRYLRGEPLR